MDDEPTAQGIVELAASLGIRLDEDEAASYHAVAIAELERLEAFLNTPMDEDRPPLSYPDREPGYRPEAADDPYHAWSWRCQVGGAAGGLLSGKEISFKDSVSVAGVPQGLASRVMDGFVPDFDATIVSRVLDAGATVVGKNAMNGFMRDSRRPLNPHSPDRTCGGSSSGSAVALAAGEVDVAFGGDQGGSIRIPAAYCGVVGLKPTFGLVSHFGVGFGSDQSIDHVGPMGRHVEDVAAALQAVAGFDRYDPRQGRDVPDVMDALGGIEDGVQGLRIGVLKEGFSELIDDDVREGVSEAVRVLAAAGAQVVEISVPEHAQVNDVFAALALEGAKAITDTGLFGMWSKTYYPASLISAVDQMWREHASEFPPRAKLNQIVAAYSRARFHGAVYAKAHNVRPGFVRAFDRALADVDVLAMPTVPTVAPAIEDRPVDRLTAIEDDLRGRNWVYLPYTCNTKPSNLTGHPALAVPCGKVGRLPISLQLVGRFFDDPLLLRIAYTYQQSVDWPRITAVDP